MLVAANLRRGYYEPGMALRTFQCVNSSFRPLGGKSHGHFQEGNGNTEVLTNLMVTVVRGSGPGSVAPKSSFLTTDYPPFLYKYSSNSTCMMQLHYHHSESGTHAGPYPGAKGSKSSFSCNHEAKATQLDSGTSKSSTQEGLHIRGEPRVERPASRKAPKPSGNTVAA